MSDHLPEFIFAGTLIVIALLSHHGTAPQGAVVVGQVVAVQRQVPPLYILDPPENSFVHLKNVILPNHQFAKISIENNSGGQVLAAENNPPSAFTRIAANQLPQIGAEIALVADLEAGERYAGIATSKHWPLASITKLMSAVVAAKHMNQNREAEVSQDDFSPGSTPKDLRIGGRYSVRDLMAAALLESSNEAIMAIASSYGRGAFIAQMNTQADVWGLSNTHFDDPTGLSAANQSTAEDLLSMAQHIFAEAPQIFSLTTEPSADINEITSGEKISVKSINNFAGRPDFLGGKTGFTDDARQNLLSVFLYAGRPVVIIVLGSNDRFGDTEKLFTWFKSNFR